MIKKQKKNKKSYNNKGNKTDGKINLLLITNCIQTVLILFFAIHIWNIDIGTSYQKIVDKTTKSITSKQNERLMDDNYVFLGDSITEWYPISSFFSDNTPIIKSGYAGYKTKDLLKDMNENVYRYNPTKVFVLIGTNDLNCDDSNSEIAYNNIIKIINNIKENRPMTEIYLESIYPVNQTSDEKIKKEATGKRKNEDIIKLNSQLKKYCEKNKIEYIDMYNELIDEKGNLKLEYTVDGLHLSTDGYSKVSSILKKYIKEK